jgi:hypothetical protein
MPTQVGYFFPSIDYLLNGSTQFPFLVSREYHEAHSLNPHSNFIGLRFIYHL